MSKYLAPYSGSLQIHFDKFHCCELSLGQFLYPKWIPGAQLHKHVTLMQKIFSACEWWASFSVYRCDNRCLLTSVGTFICKLWHQFFDMDRMRGSTVICQKLEGLQSAMDDMNYSIANLLWKNSRVYLQFYTTRIFVSPFSLKPSTACLVTTNMLNTILLFGVR